MKLTVGLGVLAGYAAAAQQAAEVFILPSTESTSTPSISRNLARLVLLQRLAPFGKGPSVHDIPEGSSAEEVVSLMNGFGKKTPSLFGQEEDTSPSQLVVLLEGLTDAQMQELGVAFGSKPAFTIADPPSSSAHDQLIKNDIYNVGVTKEHDCALKEASNPFEERCWSDKSTVARYNVQKNPHALESLIEQLPSLLRLGKSGEVETTVIVFPAASANSKLNYWSDGPQELRRRQAEQVMTAWHNAVDDPAPTSSPLESTVLFAPTANLPSCFNSEDRCVTSTGNCSGHGSCLNRYANRDGSEGKETCYACHCLSTAGEKGGLTHWAGKTCAKKDVSVAFWLFAGFTLFMVGILSLAIGLLYSVGEEKLPGVIGAGVSRSK